MPGDKLVARNDRLMPGRQGVNYSPLFTARCLQPAVYSPLFTSCWFGWRVVVVRAWSIKYGRNGTVAQQPLSEQSYGIPVIFLFLINLIRPLSYQAAFGAVFGWAVLVE